MKHHDRIVELEKAVYEAKEQLENAKLALKNAEAELYMEKHRAGKNP